MFKQVIAGLEHARISPEHPRIIPGSPLDRPKKDLKSTVYGHIFQKFAYKPIMDSSGDPGTHLE